jgi:hypothetical protein
MSAAREVPLSGQERRKHPRYPVDAPARITTGSETLAARLRDVCRDAAFVEVERPLPVQCEVALDLELPDVDQPVRVRGTVIRIGVSEFGGGSGVAVLFSDLTPEVILHIDVFISQQERLG